MRYVFIDLFYLTSGFVSIDGAIFFAEDVKFKG